MKNVTRAVAAVAIVLFAPYAQAASSRFRAHINLMQTGSPVPDARCPAGTVLVSFTGAGNVAGGGRVSAVASHCIVDDPAVEPFTHGQLTLSGRSGDIFIAYEGNDAAGDLSGTFTITGGTGAYAGATGGGTLRGTAGLDGGRGILEGTINVP